MKRKIAVILCITIFLCSNLQVFALSFSDLTKTHWAYENIMGLVENGVINGYQDGTYRPEAPVTRGEFFKLIALAIEDEKEFIIDELELKLLIYKGEIQPHWAGVYAAYLMNNGLLKNGTDDTELDEYITRLEMGVVLAKVVEFKEDNPQTTEIDDGILTRIKLTDISELDENDIYYIEKTVKEGLITGYTDKTYRPHNNMTRAEVATVISRLLALNVE